MLTRILSVFALAATIALGGQAVAGELDNETAVTNAQIAAQIKAAKDLPATLVIRVNEASKEVSVMHSQEKLAADQATFSKVVEAPFMKMDVKQGVNAAGELDQSSSASSWYFCWPTYNWAYPTYYYYGYSYNYSSYYSYSYGGYAYYYYGWRW